MFNCTECQAKIIPVPSLKDRGQTKKEFKSLFIDPRGGKCDACWIKARGWKETNEEKARKALTESLRFKYT